MRREFSIGTRRSTSPWTRRVGMARPGARRTCVSSSSTPEGSSPVRLSASRSGLRERRGLVPLRIVQQLDPALLAGRVLA